MNFKKYHVSKNLLNIDRIRSDTFTLDTVYYLNGVVYDTLGMNPSSVTVQIHDNAITIQASSYYGVGFVVPVEFGKTYHLTFNCGVSVPTFGGITQLTENGSIQKYSIIYSNSASVSITSTDTRYILIVLRCINQTAIFSNIMLNEGSTPQSYEPYSSEVWHDIPHYIHTTAADTITTLPADLYADGNNATVGISGNMEQNGTPTPQNPIQPSECGDLETTGEHAGQYKIPISSANTTTNVYLGEVETTRKIRKLVLDGTENWTYRSDDPANVFFMYLPTAKTGEVAMSNAYPYYSGTDFVDMNDKEFAIIRSNLAIRNSDYQYESQFKAYLAQQYTAGTPVTVWYVLATPTTGIVNEPLMKIGDYADTVSGITVPTITGKDTFDVDTTLKPSEVSLSYTGWHDASVKEWDGSQWNQ